MTTLCGIDEVGRGCLAGPVTVCALVFHSTPPPGIRDSKKLSALARERLDELIRATAHVSIASCGPDVIDDINILQATMRAMRMAHDGLPAQLRAMGVRVDGDRAPKLDAVDVMAVVRGDDTIVEIAAASIIAKVHRDRAMTALHQDHPHYGWSANKGYGSPAHLAGLKTHGATIHHRRTFAPVTRCIADVGAGTP